MQKHKRQQFFLIICGLLFIVGGILASEPIIASFTEDGTIGSRVIRLGLWGLSAVFVLSGIGIILLRRSDRVFRLVIMLVITGLMFAVLDYSLYLFVPFLPPNMVRLMSPQAQLRYFNANREEEPWIYETQFRHGRPGTELDGAVADEYGYRNPEDYLNGADELDILLIGDSFIWGTAEQSIADHMRTVEPEQSVYSAAVFGNSMVQWRYHFEDYINRIGGPSPHIVVLNFYAGNDLSDTEFFHRVENFAKEDAAIAYYMYYNTPYLVPSQQGDLTLPKLPETTFLLLSILVRGEQTAAEPTCLETDYSIDEAWPLINEPQSWEFNDAVLSEIDLTVAQIQKLAPDTEIVIAYIPTLGTIYGSLLTDCPWCAADIEQQVQNAALLSSRAEQLEIHFVDVTPTLQAAALEQPLWATNGHFSPAGYAIYAQALSDQLSTLNTP